MEEWKEYKLGDIVSLVIDYRGKTPLKLGGSWSESGYRALSAKNIKTGKIVNEESIRFIDEDLYKKWMKDEVQRGDILITSEAPFGQIFYWDSDEKIVLSQRLFCIRTKTDVFSKFLFYYMTTHQFQNELDGRATGTTVVGLRQPELMKCTIRLPSYDSQIKISNILSSIDEKIENNRKINENLEAQAQALFKSWFVDFEPFRDQPFVDSELGMIPKGWRVGKLGDICVTNKRTYGANFQSQILYLDTGSVTNNIIEELKLLNPKIDKIPSRARRAVTEGDIVYSSVRPNQRHFAFMYNPQSNLVASTGFVVITANWSCYRFYIYQYLIQEKIINNLHAIAEQSVSTYPSINATDITSLNIIIPPDDVIMRFAELCNSYFAVIHNNQNESRDLAKLRDTLLPKLMSGEIKV